MRRRIKDFDIVGSRYDKEIRMAQLWDVCEIRQSNVGIGQDLFITFLCPHGFVNPTNVFFDSASSDLRCTDDRCNDESVITSSCAIRVCNAAMRWASSGSDGEPAQLPIHFIVLLRHRDTRSTPSSTFVTS